MANVVSLELFKKQCNADDFTADDTLLQHYLNAAEKHVIRYTHRTREELDEMGGGEFPDELKQAVLLIGAHWYNQRESDAQAQFHSVPNALQALMKPFRKLAK
jgi:uncharacterized phiE125 gp8 family phage protein